MNRKTICNAVGNVAVIFSNPSDIECGTRKEETESEDNISSTRELIFTEDCCFPDVADKYAYPAYDFSEWFRMKSEERLSSC